ncbi:MAG: TIGR04282 family arsenosugar biosynthesis glycosyltransferase [Chloroflexota bacterium]|nr:TIGR04282 family arsenosugar biosynthesis glycosyltransferase [Chloroflexota bacterium]
MLTPRRALVVVGKAPVAGKAKTRLVPPLSPEQAAEVARAFLLDTVDLGGGLGWEQLTLVHPNETGQREALARLLPGEVRMLPQTGAGLGDALAGALAAHFAEGFDRVVLLDTDSPTLPRAILEAASERLQQCDVSLGPCADGGYYLIGLRAPRPRLFEDIAWSTQGVLRQTLERARESRLSVATLPEWYDVDSFDDLLQLERDLLARPAYVAPNTRRVLERLSAAVKR